MKNPHLSPRQHKQLQSALALQQKGCLAEAAVLYRDLLSIFPDFYFPLANLGVIALQMKEYTKAENLFTRALALTPNEPATLLNLGITVSSLNRTEEALACFERVIETVPNFVEAYFNKGRTLQTLNRYREAIASYECVINLEPKHSDAFNNLGLALHELGRYEDARARYEQAIRLKPNFPEAYCNLGNTLLALGQTEDSLGYYTRAVTLNPQYANAFYNRGNAFHLLGRFEDALKDFEAAVSFDDSLDYLPGAYLHAKMRLCDWSSFEVLLGRLNAELHENKKTVTPFEFLSVSDDPVGQKRCAELFIRDRYPGNLEEVAIRELSRHDKIRIGYFSKDFRNHAVSYLMAEVFELHDKTRFEVIGFAFGESHQDDMWNRVGAAFDRLIEVGNMCDQEVVRLSRELGIDIAVNLGGFTTGSRTGIFALRAAPIQVSYIGYLGTMGAPYIDYLLADSMIIPETYRRHYTEKIAYLPSYQANDTKRPVSGKVFTRKELGLSDSGFVYCCFNNSYKITPSIFDSWMRILGQVERSVLFLFTDVGVAAENLRREAAQRGVNPERLIFGRRLPRLEYLARYRVADLFLDTLPYNAGTTASDALWMGLPVLTQQGESFAARVAASLLNAVGLPELITTSQEAYESLAVRLATHPEELQEIRSKLARSRQESTLFDAQSFTMHIEAAYMAMYERHLAGKAPDHLYVEVQT